MQEIDFFTLFTDKFNLLNLEYIVTGSAAVIAYGEPRLTNDIDIVLRLQPDQASSIEGVFSQNDYYCPPEETLLTELRRSSRGHFNLIHHRTGLKADCFLAGEDPFQQWGLERRVLLEVDRHQVYFAPLEYVIVKKLQYYQEGKSEKHLRDIRSLFAVSGALIDRKILAQHVARLGLNDVWQIVSR